MKYFFILLFAFFQFQTAYIIGSFFISLFGQNFHFSFQKIFFQ